MSRTDVCSFWTVQEFVFPLNILWVMFTYHAIYFYEKSGSLFNHRNY